MRQYIVLFFALFGMIQINAQDMRQIWINMPDSIEPYINKSQRVELADYITMNMKSAVQNKLLDTTKIEKLTNDYILVQLNKVSRLEIKSLDSTHIALVQTWNAPVAESRLSLFSKNWKLFGSTLNVKPMFEKPDTMLQTRYEELKRMANDIMCEIKLSETDNTLTINYSVPLLSNSERAALKAVLKQRKLKWNGNSFN